MASLLPNNQTQPSRAIPLVAAALLQAAIAPQISVFGGRFNFMAAAACALAPGMAPGSAALMGFGCGLFFDLTASTPVGLMPTLLTIACFILSGTSSGHALGMTTEGARLTGAAVLVVTLVYGFVMFLLGVETSFVAAVLSHGLISAVLSALVAVPFLAFSGSGERKGGFSAVRSRGSRFKSLR